MRLSEKGRWAEKARQGEGLPKCPEVRLLFRMTPAWFWQSKESSVYYVALRHSSISYCTVEVPFQK
jgi:hypothetical protein